MRIGKFLLGLILLFIVIEAICRAVMPGPLKIVDNKTNKRIWLSEVIESSEKGKNFKPNLDLTVYNAWISYKPKLILRTNSLGLRGEEISLKAADSDNKYRIVILGDSITWSGYLPEEETYVMELQELLGKSAKNLNIRTINAGIGDAGIEEEVGFLKENFDRIKPKMVILAFYLNDSRPPWGFESEKSLSWAAQILQKSRFIGFLYSNVEIQLYLMRHGILGKGYRYRWFYHSRNPKWKNDKEYFKKLTEEADLDWGAAWNDNSWSSVEINIGELKKFSEKNNFKLLIACFPVSFQVYAYFLDNIPQRRIANIAAKLNILFLDLLPKLRENNKITLFYDHCHLNIPGQRIVSEELARFIIDNKLML